MDSFVSASGSEFGNRFRLQRGPGGSGDSSLMRDNDLDRLRKAFGQGRVLGTHDELECLLARAGDDACDSEFRAMRGEVVTEDDLRGEPPAVDLGDRGLAPPGLARECLPGQRSPAIPRIRSAR